MRKQRINNKQSIVIILKEGKLKTFLLSLVSVKMCRSCKTNKCTKMLSILNVLTIINKNMKKNEMRKLSTQHGR